MEPWLGSSGAAVNQKVGKLPPLASDYHAAKHPQIWPNIDYIFRKALIDLFGVGLPSTALLLGSVFDSVHIS